MCNKQCRDENGFKCHCLSESHNRQMAIFSENPGKFMNDYSKDFERAYLLIARIKGKRIKANTIYKDLISDRSHIHMNATIWATLTNFVTYLGKTGKCIVDKVGKDWYVKFNSNDPREIARRNAERRSRVLRAGDEDLDRRLVLEQMRLAEEAETKHREKPSKVADVSPAVFSERAIDEPPGLIGRENKTAYASLSERENETVDDKKRRTADRLAFAMGKREKAESATGTPKSAAAQKTAMELFREGRELQGERGCGEEGAGSSSARREARAGRRDKSAQPKDIDRIMKEEQSERAKAAPLGDARWLLEGLVVKIGNKDFCGGRFFGRKAVVDKVLDGFTAEVVAIKSGEVIKIDQKFLENVLPPIGKPAVIILGRHKGEKCSIRRVDEELELLNIALDSNPTKNIFVPYFYVCKLSAKYLTK